jgi:hypothetical protein
LIANGCKPPKENSTLLDKNGIPIARKNKYEKIWRAYSEELLNRKPAHMTKVTATEERATGEVTDTDFCMLDIKIAFYKN